MEKLEHLPLNEVAAKIEKLWKWNEKIEDDATLSDFITQNRYIASIVTENEKSTYSTNDIQEFISFVECQRTDAKIKIYTYDLDLYRSERYDKYFLAVYVRDLDDSDTDSINLVKPESYIPNWRLK